MGKTLVIGRPARYAQKLLLKNRPLLVGVLAGLGGALWLVTSGPGMAGQLLAVAALAGSGIASQHYQKRRGQLLAGIRSEQRVARILRNAGYAAVIHGVDLGRGGDADHVVLGPCVAAIETKTGRGKVRTTRQGLAAGRKTLPGDPIAQARRQADGLSRAVGRAADAICCIVDMDGPPQKIGGVTVCSARHLPEVLSSFRQTISREEAVRQARALPLA